jgi:hypothetical protein
MFVVVNSQNKVFGGFSPLFRQPMWWQFSGDAEAIDRESFKFRRDPRWLALARKYDATCEWKEI